MKHYLIVTRDGQSGYVASTHSSYDLAAKAASRVGNRLYSGQRTIIVRQFIHLPKQSDVEYNQILGMWVNVNG